MTSRRTAKVSRAIQEAVSTTVLFGLRDPRIKNVTVTRVEAADDVRSARVYVSVRGDAKMTALSLKGLNAARGYLQSKVADRLQTKNTPILRFIIDTSVKQSVALAAAFRATESEGAAAEGVGLENNERLDEAEGDGDEAELLDDDEAGDDELATEETLRTGDEEREDGGAGES